MSKDLIKYFNNHEGIKVTKHFLGVELSVDPKLERITTIINNEPFVIIKTRCKHLNINNSCNIYDKSSKPQTCRTAYNEVIEGILFCPNCIYENKNGLNVTKKTLKELKL